MLWIPRKILIAAVFISITGATFSVHESYQTADIVRTEEVLVQGQERDIHGLQMQISELRSDIAKKKSDRNSKILEALARYCLGIPKAGETASWPPLPCPAEGEVCDAPSKRKCADEHPSYDFP